jgi:cytochrome d ubiquinol oxidase subunit II
MTLPEIYLAIIWVGLTAYVLFGGADFGGGFWDLVAGGTRRGLPQRRLIEHTIGPVWEANHVWLIFVIVLLWTGFPGVFAAVASTMYIPLTLAALGIIGRGAAFAFRKASEELTSQRLYGAVFAASSVLTPFFLGAVAGGVASGRVPPGIAQGDTFTSWVNPTSIAVGLLSTGVGAYLAAVFLTREAERAAPELVDALHRRAIAAGCAVGVLAAGCLFVVRADAPEFFGALTSGAGLILVAISAVSGAASLALLVARRYLALRVTAALTVAAVLWGWGVGQYPQLLPGLDVAGAAATRPVLNATVIALGIGAAVLIPSMWWMYTLFQRPAPER